MKNDDTIVQVGAAELATLRRVHSILADMRTSVQQAKKAGYDAMDVDDLVAMLNGLDAELGAAAEGVVLHQPNPDAWQNLPIETRTMFVSVLRAVRTTLANDVPELVRAFAAATEYLEQPGVLVNNDVPTTGALSS